MSATHLEVRRRDDVDAIDEIRASATPLRSPADLDQLVERVGEARFVLVGEASHGTMEYYAWRASLTRRLIEEKGFSFVAVEGDWPDCQAVNRWVKGRIGQQLDAVDALGRYQRWPTWMWANHEVARFIDWLRDHNRRTSADIGFYGLDVYSLWDSLRAVLAYLEAHDPEAVATAREALHCFEPYVEDPQAYALATRGLVPVTCQDAVVDLLVQMRAGLDTSDGDPEARFDAEQNAAVAAEAERYYRTMVRADGQSWNVRDQHMADTLDRLMERHGSDARAVVWEHNTHVGDARATDMALAGMVNVGQLVRERHGNDDVVLIGAAGHHGSVLAASAWGAPVERMPVPDAPQGTHEELLHQALGASSVLVFPEDRSTAWLGASRGHRAIGVVYRPAADRPGNWVPTVMGDRYDVLFSFEATNALRPLHREDAEHDHELDTYPWGT